jgi:hypothetical protein
LLLIGLALWVALARRAPESGAAVAEALEASLAAMETAISGPTPRYDAALEAGAAKLEIAPPLDWGVPLAGNRKLRFTRAVGTRPESVWARAVALRQGPRAGIVISADIMVISPELANRTLKAIQQVLPITADQLMLVAAHTHSGPGGYWEGGLAEMSVGAYQERILDFLVDRLSRVAVDAWDDVREVTVATAEVDLEFTIKNRAWKGGPENPILGILRLQSVDGQRQIDLINYSAHPTNLLSGNNLFTGDYPALMASLLDESGRSMLFMPGTIGDQKPSFFRIRDGARRARLIADYLVREGLEKASFVAVRTPILETFEFEVTMPPLQPRLRRTGMFGFWFARPWLAHRVLPADLDQATVQIVRIGSAVLIGAPSDLATSVGLPLLAQARRLGLAASFVSMADDWIGYVMTEDEYLNVDYKSKTQFHGPQSGPVFSSVYQQVIETLARRNAASTVDLAVDAVTAGG